MSKAVHPARPMSSISIGLMPAFRPPLSGAPSMIDGMTAAGFADEHAPIDPTGAGPHRHNQFLDPGQAGRFPPADSDRDASRHHAGLQTHRLML